MSYPGYDLHRQGIALFDAGRYPEALASCEAARALSPEEAGIHYTHAGALFMLGRMEDALADYDLCLQLRPDMAVAHYGRANTLQQLRRLAEALTSLDQALTLQPGMAQAWNNRSGVLFALGRPEEALESTGQAIRLRPRDDGAYYNAGIMLLALSRYGEAQGAFETALSLNPDHPDALGFLCSAALRAGDWPRLAQLSPYLFAAIRQGKVVVAPLILLALSGDPALQRKCAERYAANELAVQPPPLWTGERYTHDKIRIAYIATDFHGHATAFLMAGLFERHDRARFEITAISFGPDDTSPMRARLLKAFDHFIDVRGLDDAAVAGLMHDRRIDIAVDLKGHTEDGRPGILARRPCPVQVAYLGFPCTTATPYLDYLIGDKHVTPFEDAAFFSEKLVHMPHSYQVNDDRRAIAPATPSRVTLGLPQDGFVFCCFNINWKIDSILFDVWMRLLTQVEGSVLWLLRDNDYGMDNLRRQAAAHGIDPARLVFAERAPLDEHLARHAHADLFLDTLPCNAHTTASDALWAGLPVLTVRGTSFSGRVATSLLHAVDLPELVTEDLAAYEALALALARDPARLAALKARLGVANSAHPLFDTDGFRRDIERAFTVMTERARAGLPPQAFAV